MRYHKLVLPSDLNHYGYLFGGQLLKWVDEFSWITATLEYPGCKFVTIGLDKVEFRHSVRQGTILVFEIERSHQGLSSVQYRVEVRDEDLETGREGPVFTTHITFVCLDHQGDKRGLPQRVQEV